MNKRDRDWERRRDGDREGVWAAPVGIPAGQKSGKGRWCLSGRLSSVPGWRSGWTLQVSREETPDWKSEVWKGSGRRHSSICGRWETEKLCTGKFTVELCEKKCHPVTVKTVWYPLLQWRMFEKVWENNVLLALWIANYNNKPFVRNLSIEFYFKWMLQMTTLHSTKSLSSAYRYRTCEREIAFDAAALTITPYWSLLVGVNDVGQVNWKKLSISSKVLPKVPLNNSMFKVWRFWFEMPCACSLEVFTRAELNASKLQSFNYTNRCPNQHSSVKLFFGDLFLNRNETNGELETDLVHFVYQS